MNKKFLFLLALLAGISFPAELLLAQTNDAGLWVSAGVEKKVSKKAFVTLSEEVRLNENFSQVGSLLTDVGGGVKVGLFKFSANYRYSLKRQLDGYYDGRHRFYFDFSARKKFEHIAISNRLRFQNQYEGFRSEMMGQTNYYLREAMAVKFRVEKRLQPFVSGEIFIPLSYMNSYYIDNVRVKLGADYELNEKNALEFYYMVQREFNVRNPGTDFILGLGYNFSF